MRRRNFLVAATASGVATAAAIARQPSKVLSEEQSARVSKAVPFKIAVPQATLDQIRSRVRAINWPDTPATPSWDYGPNLTYMKEFSAYWVNQYDWRRHERELNRLNHYKAQVEGEQLHFIYEKGSGQNPQPLILFHGWPYSFATFRNLIEPLAHPERFGGKAADAFDVIVPSHPGFGFSDKPVKPLGPRAIALRMHRLMTQVLGYDRYLAQGGDWGAQVAQWIAFEHPSECAGIHVNLINGVNNDGSEFGIVDTSSGSTTAAERETTRRLQRKFRDDFAYNFYQAKRPLTLSYGMTDSPIGAAAWILDKFYLWSDRRERPFEALYTKDQLLTEVMVYLVTQTFDTSTWIYRGYMTEKSYQLPLGKRIEQPVAFAAFPDPLVPTPSRNLVERAQNIVQWTKMPRGGHFPMLEQPALYMEDIRKFGRFMRSSTT
jgi:microsomal epoxide hydrolase